ANVEGTPKELAVERSTGSLARVGFGSRQVTKTADGKPVGVHPRCQHVARLLESSKGKLDRRALQGFLADHGAADDPATRVCVPGSPLDAMLFAPALREAHVCRGPACSGRWQRFTFEGVGRA